MSESVLVYASIDGDDLRAGRLFSHRRRGTESASFSYDERFLADPRAFALDPGLPLVSGLLQTSLGLSLFRAFTDSSPDRWGRHLILRAERARARSQNSAARSFGEYGLLLGVRDDLRQGALRFQADDSGAFLATEELGVPQLTDLPSLMDAAARVDLDIADNDDLTTLLRAGSSLGGARPKAHVLDRDGRLAMAKFPSPAADRWNVIAWEKTALDLAERAGLQVPKSRLIRVDGRDVLVVERFDREIHRRVGYVSAMTMLEAGDGDVRSYLDMGSVIEEHSPAATAELRELWKRIAFSIIISNTDDHLRNHGFLHVAGDSWTLSPAFDLNPNPAPGLKHLSTAVDDADTTASIKNLMGIAGLFRLPSAESLRALAEVVAAARGWESAASGNGLTRAEIADMAPAFEHPEADLARSLTS